MDGRFKNRRVLSPSKTNGISGPSAAAFVVLAFVFLAVVVVFLAVVVVFDDTQLICFPTAFQPFRIEGLSSPRALEAAAVAFAFLFFDFSAIVAVGGL